jgi:hypothetical protein
VAVVQISRIQVRRGQANQGSGIPQLAGGEFGWAVDGQELYIGNGSVAEGAPFVGNSKVLTEHDDLFSLVGTYAYKRGSVDTGEGIAVERTLNDRLDDIVSVRSFGCAGDGSDVTTKLQKALYELFLNGATRNNPQSRVVLHVEPGIYRISSTIHIPPYATIVGAGKEKTVFIKTGDFTMFQTISSDTTYDGVISNTVVYQDPTMSYANSARYISFKDCTLQTESEDGTLLVLNSCRDSRFENVKFEGTKLTNTATNPAVQIRSKSDAVRAEFNRFIDCEFVSIGKAIVSNHNISRNEIDSCKFFNITKAIELGVTPTIGQANATDNNIRECYFETIEQQAIHIANGTRNSSINNRFGPSVGNNGGSETTVAHSIIKFGESGNISVDNEFDRTYNLSINQAYIVSKPYIPEVEGPAFYEHEYTEQVDLAQIGTPQLLFRLAADTTKSFDIDYWYKTDRTGIVFSRSGTLTVFVNRENNSVSIMDDYDISGLDSLGESLLFSATLNELESAWSAQVKYTNQLDSGKLTFKIRSRS